MSRFRPAPVTAAAMASVIALAGCVPPGPPPPPQPTVMAVPGQGKSYQAFQQDDGYCRQQASYSVNGVNPGAAATQNGVASAVVGTGIGAAAGALLGAAVGRPGVGAALGAGTGLLVGSSAGAQNAAYTGNAIQRHYNMTYAQCMIGHGNQIQNPYGPPPGYYAPPPGYNAPPPPPPGY